MPIMVFWCSFVHNFMFPFLTRTRKTLHICLDLAACCARGGSLPLTPCLAQPSPAPAQPSPAPALPCHYFYFLCGWNWPRRVSCRDHWSCAEQCKFPHSICKIHCTFAKTFQVLSAYQYHKLHCLKNIFIFVFRYFCRQETLRHVNCSGNNIT